MAGLSKHLNQKFGVRLPCRVFQVPKVLVAEKHETRVKILGTIRQMEAHLRQGNCRIKLDFSKVEKIFPGGMLIFLSALQRLTTLYPNFIRARCPPHSLSSQLLNHFGLAKALSLNTVHSAPKDISVVQWDFLHGSQADGPQVRDLLNKYRTKTNAAIPEALFPALTEGLTNVRQHAYNADSGIPPSLQNWWIFARMEDPTEGKRGYLYIAIYDIGYGIPATLRRKLNRREVVWDIVDKAGQLAALTTGRSVDKHLLQMAIEYRRSQTGSAHRGNGLPEMREFAQSNQNGRLHVISGKAQYSYISGRSDGHTQGFKDDFPGTLILWGIPLVAKEKA